MSSEPNSPMDPLLRELARKRREQSGAPTSLHPANRRVLQAEVRAVHGGKGGKGEKPSAWWFRWQSWAGLGTAAVALLALAFWWPDGRSERVEKLAKLERSYASPAPTSPATLPLGSIAESEQLGLSKGKGVEPRYASTPAPPVAATDATEAKNLADRDQLATRAAERRDGSDLADLKSAANNPSQNESRSKQLSAPAVAKTPKDQNVNLLQPDPGSAGLPLQAVTLQLNFVQVLPSLQARKEDLVRGEKPARPAEPAPVGTLTGATISTQVLSRFALNYANGSAEVVDHDGSVYRGSLQPVLAEDAANPRNSIANAAASNRQQVQGNALGSPVVQAGNYRLLVSGTNRSLQRAVVMEGNLQNVATPAPPPAELGGSLPSYQFTWQLDSTVKVGQASAWPFRAVETSTNANAPAKNPSGPKSP